MPRPKKGEETWNHPAFADVRLYGDEAGPETDPVAQARTLLYMLGGETYARRVRAELGLPVGGEWVGDQAGDPEWVPEREEDLGSDAGIFPE